MFEKNQQNDVPAAYNKEDRQIAVKTIKKLFAAQENLQAPVPPADFENLPAFRRACESINYNLCAMEYKYFPRGQLRKSIILCIVVFFIIGVAWLALFTATKGIQHILAPLPKLFANGILILAIIMVFLLFLMNFLKIMKFITTIISKIVLKKTK